MRVNLAEAFDALKNKNLALLHLAGDAQVDLIGDRRFRSLKSETHSDSPKEA